MFLSQRYSFEVFESFYEIIEGNNPEIFKIRNSTGSGGFKSYKVFPGVYITYNEFNMSECTSNFKSDINMFCIDYCKEGRMEWICHNNDYLYLKQGDMQISIIEHHGKKFEFPIKKYSGITVVFYLDEANQSIKKVLNNFDVDLYDLKDKLCPKNEPFIMRTKSGIEHVFNELYQVDDQIRDSYLKIKILELLLFFKTLDVNKDKEERNYFTKSQVDKVKEIEKYMIKNIDKHITLEELSNKFDYSLTSMKKCFKEVYGDSIYSYMKSYRMNEACILLKETNDNISNIASYLGYDNPSKFAAAFKSVIGFTPLKYRNKEF